MDDEVIDFSVWSLCFALEFKGCYLLDNVASIQGVQGLSVVNEQ